MKGRLSGDPRRQLGKEAIRRASSRQFGREAIRRAPNRQTLWKGGYQDILGDGLERRLSGEALADRHFGREAVGR